MSKRNLAGYRGHNADLPSSPEYVEAFRTAVRARQEYVRHVQELRRSGAASPVTRKSPRSAERRRAINDQE